MAIFNSIQNIFSKKPKEDLPDLGAELINFRITIAEFADNIESSNAQSLADILKNKEGLNIKYYDEPFQKSFLSLESRTLFDLIDKGQDIIDKTDANVLIWGCREGNKIRLNFQADRQYETEAFAFLSLMDSLYIPAEMFHNMEDGISNLIYGAAVSAIKSFDKETKIKKRYLLKKIIDKLSKDSAAQSLSLEYMPYIMNFLGAIYLSYSFDNGSEKDSNIVKGLLDNALKHQDLITNPIHLGCIYNHLGQLYDCGTEYMEKKTLNCFKGAITYYRQAQKFLGKYTYPYDYGFISFKLSKLFFSFWRQKDDLQALRDAVFQMREAEKIYTLALFPEFWAEIEGNLGYMLSLLGNITKSEDISELAIAAYKNQQKIITEKRDAFHWAKIQEKIGEIYYRLGKAAEDKPLLEEALEYFHDALYIFENMERIGDTRSISINIQKTSLLLNEL